MEDPRMHRVRRIVAIKVERMVRDAEEFKDEDVIALERERGCGIFTWRGLPMRDFRMGSGISTRVPLFVCRLYLRRGGAGDS